MTQQHLTRAEASSLAASAIAQSFEKGVEVEHDGRSYTLTVSTTGSGAMTGSLSGGQEEHPLVGLIAAQPEGAQG